MSEMSAEKKKKIEKYIIKSYFGGGKNVEPFAGGVDVIKGTDDGNIPQLLVEVTYFGGSGDVMINWGLYDEFDCDSEWENSFALRVCKERTIEKNRCDAVDSMSYAWEAWRAKIQNKPLFLETSEKDKRIEELEKEVNALRAEKEAMERHIQELESHNVSLAETNTVLRNSKDSYLRMVKTGATYLKDWEEATGCAKPEYVKKKIYTLERECRVWHDTADHQLEQIHGLEGDISDLYDKNEELKSQIKEWKEKTQRCTPFLAGLRISILRDSDTRHRNLLFGEAKPADIMVFVGGEKKTIRKYLRDKNFASVVNAINELESEIDEWQKATGCLRPEDISTNSMISESVANEIKVANEKLWSENEKLERTIEEWQKATGCKTPKDAETTIRNLNDRLGGFIQAASCAERHLEHVLIWKQEQTGQEVK